MRALSGEEVAPQSGLCGSVSVQGSVGREASRSDGEPSSGAQDIQDFLILPPLDCSLVAENVEPGTAILIHLWRTLQQEYSRLIQNNEEFFAKLPDLAATYSRTAKPYHELCVELSASPGDYGNYVVEGVSERFELPGRFRVWLGKFLDMVGYHSVVILLDDFDLVPAQEVRRWLLSLLDELHQSRLFFVLTADFYRLQHLSWDPEAEFDDKTGRALLDKLLPSQNCIRLSGWTPFERHYFPRLEDDGLPVQDDEGCLANRVRPFGEYGAQSHYRQQVLLMQLLPQWPRGIINLYRTLEENFSSGSGASIGEARAREFFSALATSRGEPLLARKLLEESLDSWIEKWQFIEDVPLSVEDWSSNVAAALERASLDGQPEATVLPHEKVLRPIRGLSPPRPRRADLKKKWDLVRLLWGELV